MEEHHPEGLSPGETLRVLAQVVEQSPDLVSVVDRLYVYRVVNPAHVRAHGRPAEEIVGRTVADLEGDAAFQTTIRPNLDRCFAGESVRYEGWSNLRAAGRRYMEIQYYPLPGAAGADYAVILSRDISERKRAGDRSDEPALLAARNAAPVLRIDAEGRIAHSEGDALSRLAGILESITDAFYALDDRWRFTYVNAEAERLLGKRREALLGCSILEEFPDASGSEFYRQYRRAVSEHHPVRFEDFYAPLGRWFDVSAYPSREGLSVYFRDITAQKSTEQELRDSKEHFRELVEATSDWLWEIDENFAYTYASPRARRLLGYEPDELLGRTPLDLMPPEEARRVGEIFAPIVAERRPFASLENTNRHRDGHLVVLETSGVPLFDAAGRFCGYRGIDRDITDRKRAEQALRDSEDRFRKVFEEGPLGLAIVGLDFRMLKVNTTLCQMLGYSEQELQTLAFPDFTVPDDVAEDVEQAGRLLRGEIPHYAIEKRYVRRSGEIIWADLRVSVIHDDQGSPLYVLKMIQDITERKAAESALNASERLLRRVLEALPLGVWILDANGRIVLGNPAGQQIWGGAKYVGMERFGEYKGWWADTGKPIEPLEWGAARALLRGESRLDEEIEIEAFDGSRKFILHSAVPIRDEAGRITGAVVLNQDIGERKRWEQEREGLLEEARRRAAELDVVISSIADAVSIVDARGRIVRLNPAAERILGYTPEERQLPLAHRADLRCLQAPDGTPFPVEALPISKALQRGETTSGVLMLVRNTRAGTATWVSSSSAPIRAADGRIIGAVTVHADVTGLKKLQEQREDFIRAVSHDLRNPLNILMTRAQVIRRLADQSEILGMSAAIVQATARRMDAMIRDLVDSVQMEDGQLGLDRQPVPLAPFLTDLLERNKEVLEVGRVKADIPDDIPPVLADPNRLDRIVTNLASNALKYSAPGTDVRICAVRTAGEVEVSVKDSGVGIAPDDLPHVFDRHFRARSARTHEGLGLGLYITRMLVLAHGGSIRVESTPGGGSTFSFTLPAA
jgi:PAS domain S-box-containing protein